MMELINFLKSKSYDLNFPVIEEVDKIVHITEVPSLLYLAISKKQLGIKEGTSYVEAKLKRSWNKLCPEAKMLVKNEYEAALLVLNDNNIIS